MAMVKANAYGHGVLPIVHFASEELGAKNFGLATLSEAIEIREELPQLKAELYVFSDVQIALKDGSEIYLNRRILPVISQLSDLEFFLAHRDFSHCPLVLKFNTGMNRLGLGMDEVSQVIDLLKKSGRKSIHHLMTHLASSSKGLEHEQNKRQIENYLALKKDFRASAIEIEHSSLANSGAIEEKIANVDGTTSFVRPGLMLFGGGHSSEIISRLETYILHSFPVKKGTPIGYEGILAPSDGQILIMALGYGDGITNSYQGVELNYRGQRGYIFGRVNMDMAQVFFPEGDYFNHHDPKGETLILWGDRGREGFDKLVKQAKLIPYEAYCLLSRRIPRVYTS